MMMHLFKWIGVIVTVAGLGLVTGCTETPEQRAENARKEQQRAEQRQAAEAQAKADAKKALEALPQVTARELTLAYSQNTVAADMKFKDKQFRVSGVVKEIATGLMGDPYLVLAGGVNEFMEPQFHFSKSESEALARLKQGATVKLACTGNGDVAKTPMSGDCKLL